MRRFDLRVPVAVAAALALIACGEKTSAPGATPQPSGAAGPVAGPQPGAPPAASPAPQAEPAPTPAPSTAAAPTEVAKPPTAPGPEAKADARPSPAPKPEAAAPAPARPPAEKPSAHAKVGADKCKMCHRVQHQSWVASPHAEKGLDCEGCHGNGADYWPAGVMRDRAKAVAAGLVMPALAACKRCHGAKADAALFQRVHAHKAR